MNRKLALVATGLLLLAGCGAHSSAASSSSASHSAVSQEPEPSLPPEATGEDETAAAAFVGFYLKLLDYAEHTGDVTALTKYSAESCEGCHTYIDYYRNLYAAGGFTSGTTRTCDELRVVEDPSQAGSYLVYFQLTHSGGVDRKDASSKEETTSGETISMGARATPTATRGWALYEYATTESQ
jgi:hypothetical protein